MGHGDGGMGRGISGIDGDRAFEQAARGDIGGAGRRPHLLAPAQEKLEGFDVDLAPLGQTVLLADRQLQLERGDDLLGQFILNGENIVEIAIEAARPDMAAARRIDQLRGDADAIARLADAAFEDIANVERLGDLGDWRDGLLVKERRIARDDMQFRQFGEVGDDVFADAVGEIFLLGVAAHVVEGEHGDRRLARSGRRRRFLRRGLFGWSRGFRLRRYADLERIDADRLEDVLELRLARYR